MEEYRKKNGTDANDKEIVYSQAIKAGKRIYYVDVKKNRKDEMFVAITESKKIVTGEGEDSQISFEKHKIFLYKEDFEKFLNGLQQAICFIENAQPNDSASCVKTDDKAEALAEKHDDKENSLGGDIKIDIDF